MNNHKETIQLPFDLKNNNAGQGNRWFKSDKIRKEFESELRKRHLTRSPFLFPVKLTVTRVLGKRQQLFDSDSIGRGNFKQMLDALVACGWFSDDRPKFITIVDYRQDACRRSSGPFVEIEIEQDGEFFTPPKHPEII